MNELKMVRPKLLHEQVSKIHSFERGRYIEFEELCKEQDVSVSEGLRLLIERELEKKVKGEIVEPNPLNLPRNTIDTYVCNPKKSLESKNNILTTLDQWIAKLKTMESIPAIAKIQGHHNRVAEKCKARIYQLKSTGADL